MLENSRFEPGETRNDPELAAALARLADVYVDDAFGAAHRAHATTEGVAHLLPGYAGLLLEREVRELTAVRDDPVRPFCVVLGGAKVTDKIGVIDRFLETADSVLIGGAMCFSFFRARGVPTGVAGRGGGHRARRARPRTRRDFGLRAPAAHRPGGGAGVRRRDRGPRARRHRRARRLDGAGHRSADRGRVLEGDRRGRNRALERPDGRLRAGAVRGRHPRGRRGRRRGARLHRGRRRRLRGRARRVRAGGPGRLARPAAAPRSSCWRGSRCPGWRPYVDNQA